MTPQELLALQIDAARSVVELQRQVLDDAVTAAERIAARQVNAAVTATALEIARNPTS